jgi:hypothetical protein
VDEGDAKARHLPAPQLWHEDAAWKAVPPELKVPGGHPLASGATVPVPCAHQKPAGHGTCCVLVDTAAHM